MCVCVLANGYNFDWIRHRAQTEGPPHGFQNRWKKEEEELEERGCLENKKFPVL